jgi:cytochrome c oxidase subunit 1
VGGMVMAYFAGLHYWWPKMTGKLYLETPARLAALLIFVGFNFTFFPQFVLGYLGMPRRYHMYPHEFQMLNVLSTSGASILGIGYLLPMCYFGYSLLYGRPAPANPWAATGLEWQTTSPPPTHNFDEIPVINTKPYAYDENKAMNGAELPHVPDTGYEHGD